jgi:hypothetical protein
MRARTLLAVAILAVAAASVSAQSPADYRAVQLRMLEQQRSTFLAMADSMPESLYRDAVTEPQRDFAQQIVHAVGAVGMIAQRYLGGTAVSPDTAAVLNTRAGLEDFVNQVYDAAEAALEAQTDAQRTEVVDFFGMMEIPRWQIWDEINLHSIWTAGQVVANFRKHGMPPPAFTFF